MTLSLSDAGLTIDTVDEIIAEFNAGLIAGISANLNTVAPDPLAVATSVVAIKCNALEELLLALYANMDPDAAAGDQLVGLSLLSGTERQPATKTVVTCGITVDAAFGPQAPGTMFASVVGAPGILYTNVNSFSAGGAGTTAGVVFQCTTAGANPVNASTLTVIASPINHWTAITNPAAGVAGSDVQSDASLRIAREAQLAAIGSTSAAAIRADILRLIQPSNSPLTIEGIKVGTDISNNPYTITLGIVSCTVLWNDTDAVDAHGLPAHSIEVIVYFTGGGGDTEATNALCALILADKAAGIGTYSLTGTYKTITDDQGATENVYYSLASALSTDISLTVKTRAGFATITSDQVKDAIYRYAQGTTQGGVPISGAEAHWTPGATAYASSIIGACFEFIPGVDNVTVPVLSAANVGADCVPTARQIVTIGNITPTIT